MAPEKPPEAPVAGPPLQPMLSPRRLAAVALLLYVAEGLPAGLINDFVPVWLKSNNTSLEAIGLATLVGLPWTLKALWAPIVDRNLSGPVWAGLCSAIIAILTVALLGTGASSVGFVLLVAIAVASATQDVAIDGYVANLSPKELHGRVNGLRVAGFRAGLLVAGGAALSLVGIIGWEWALAGVAAVAALLSLFAVGLPRIPVVERTPTEWLAVLRDWALKDGALAFGGLLLFVLLFKVGDAAMAPMVKPFWMDKGLSEAEVGLVSVTIGGVLTAVGALMGGELATRIGLFRALWLLGAVQAVSNLGYAAAAMAPSRSAIYAASAGESLSTGLGTAAYLAVVTRVCAGDQAVTRFALLTAIAVFTRTLSGALSGYGAVTFGYPGYFALTFLAALPAFALLPVIRRRLTD